jgi:hypothetical protein
MITGWYIVEGYSLAVKVNLELNNYFDYTQPGAIKFYDPDEPIGHSIPIDEIYTRDEAIGALFDLQEYHKEKKIKDPELYEKLKEYYETNWTLNEWRQRYIDGINKTHGENASLTLDYYKPKKEMEEWFNYSMLVENGVIE